MNFLKKLMGTNDVFFDLLEEGAEEAQVSVDLFAKFLRQMDEGKQPAGLDDFIQTRRKEKRIRHLMTEALSRTFVTPLDREDIEALSFALYRIPKQVEKTVERISIYPGPVPFAGFFRQAELMSQAAEAVAFMVKQLRHGANIEKIREVNDRLQFAEGEADKVVLGLLKELYHSSGDAKELIILRDIYEMSEQAV